MPTVSSLAPRPLPEPSAASTQPHGGPAVCSGAGALQIHLDMVLTLHANAQQTRDEFCVQLSPLCFTVLVLVFVRVLLEVP